MRPPRRLIRRLVRRHGIATLVALLVGLALRLLVPVGFMPAAGGGLTLCTGHGAVPGKPDATTAAAPCAFAALTAIDAGSGPPPLATASAAWVRLPPVPLAPVAPAPAPRLHPPSRGPPALA